MPLHFSPPLLNSANPWATTKDDLQLLYDCPFTGAVTIRTGVLGGFAHDDRIHQYGFFGNSEFLSSLGVVIYLATGYGRLARHHNYNINLTSYQALKHRV